MSFLKITCLSAMDCMRDCSSPKLVSLWYQILSLFWPNNPETMKATVNDSAVSTRAEQAAALEHSIKSNTEIPLQHNVMPAATETRGN